MTDGASVVICARNAERTLAVQLSAVLAQESDFDFEVVVVDNGSTDGTASIIALAALLDRRVLPVYESEPGLNNARNAGVRSAAHDRILMCDADDVVEAGWLQAMAHALEGRVYAGGARVRGGLNTPKELELLGIAELEPSVRRSTKLGVPTPGGANCAFRKTMWGEVNGFNPGIRSALDEEEFFARAYLAGWQMVEVPEAVIQYFVPAEPVTAFQKGYRYGRDVEEAKARYQSALRGVGSTASPGENGEAGRPVDASATRAGRTRQRWASILRESPRVLVSRSGRSDWTRRLGSELGHIVGDTRVRLLRLSWVPIGNKFKDANRMLTPTTSLAKALRLPDHAPDADRFMSEPTVLFEITEFLPEEVFRKLDAAYPTGSSRAYNTHAVGDKKYLDNRDPRFWKVLEESVEWRQLYEAFTTVEVLDRLYRLTAPYLGHRPVAEQLPWRLTQQALRKPGLGGRARRAARDVAWARRIAGVARRLRRNSTAAAVPSDVTPVYLGFEFSTLGKGDRIPPHTDVASKLLSLMVYFPASSDQSRHPLGTEFYRARAGREGAAKWDSDMPDDKETAAFFLDHETYYQVPFTENSLVGFVKTDRSWHGLRSIDLPGGEERRALIVNVFRA